MVVKLASNNNRIRSSSESIQSTKNKLKVSLCKLVLANPGNGSTMWVNLATDNNPAFHRLNPYNPSPEHDQCYGRQGRTWRLNKAQMGNTA